MDSAPFAQNIRLGNGGLCYRALSEFVSYLQQNCVYVSIGSTESPLYIYSFLGGWAETEKKRLKLEIYDFWLSLHASWIIAMVCDVRSDTKSNPATPNTTPSIAGHGRLYSVRRPIVQWKKAQHRSEFFNPFSLIFSFVICVFLCIIATSINIPTEPVMGNRSLLLFSRHWTMSISIFEQLPWYESTPATDFSSYAYAYYLFLGFCL